MKVLVADDSPVSLGLLKKVLSSWNYEVVTCTDGKAAWKMLQEESSPKLVVLDRSMPEIEGIDVCKKIREANLDRYVILLTAKDTAADIIEGLQAGADDYICKPFKKEGLYLRLRAGERIVSLREQLHNLKNTT